MHMQTFSVKKILDVFLFNIKHYKCGDFYCKIYRHIFTQKTPLD